MGNQTQFTDQTTGGVQPYSYQWNFGLGNSTPDSTNSNPTYIYTQAGIYNVNLLVGDSSSQSSNSQKSVTVFPKPSVDFSFLVDKSCTDGGRITNFSTDTTGQLIWTFGDGTTSVVTNPSHLYKPGTYHASLSVIDDNGCQNVVSKDVFIPACTGTLVVEKKIINDNGATATYSDFSFIINGGTDVAFDPNTGQNTFELPAGKYTVSENPVSTYQTTYSTDCQPATIVAGSPTTCTITNNDIAPTLKLIKIVNTDYGSTAVASDFVLSASDGQVVVLSGTGPEVGPNIVEANTLYTLSESGPDGYTPSSWTCVGGGVQTDNTITLGLSESAVCTITNTALPGNLIVKKVIKNIYGDTAPPTDFSFKVGNESARQFEADGQNDIPVDAGFYTVTEVPVYGYISTDDGNCQNIYISNGQTQTCTITNTAIQPQLTVTKEVVNSPFGDKQISNFPLFVSQVGGSPVSVTSGFSNGFNAGSYQVYEINQPGYVASFSGDCDSSGNVTLNVGDTNTCTITNTSQYGQIIIKKQTIPESDPATFGFTGDVVGNIGNGQTIVSTVLPGTYSVGESVPSGWLLTNIDCSDDDSGLSSVAKDTASINISSGESVTCVFINTKLGSISGYKYEDTREDGVKKGIPNWIISLGTGLTTVTNSDGFYIFDNLLPATYTVREQPQIGWTQTSLNPEDVVLEAGENVENVNFWNFKHFDVVACKQTSEGYPVEDWKISLDKQEEYTNSVGCVTYTITSPGQYLLSEENRLGWTPQSPVLYSFTATSGAEYKPFIFTNFQNSYVEVTKFNDLNGNGKYDKEDEPTLPDWKITLSETSKFTDQDGKVVFDITSPGVYQLSEDQKPNWSQTAIYCIKDGQPEEPSPTPADTLFDILTNLLIKPVEAQEAVIDQNTLPIDITSGQNYQCFIGNKRLVPKAYISKTNNALGNLSPGGQVTYTIKVRILDADIADLKITDLLSNGFIYRPGSYYIVKNGSQDITSLVPEAEYHSPGVWSIGNLLAGDYIELSYIADIDSNQATGKYTDLAWAMGKVVDSDDTIVALADPQGQISDNFVGTVVPILKPLSPSSSVDVENEVIRQTEGQVLGATTLPATGASLIWILFSVISFMVGLFFIKKSSSMAKTLSVLFFIILSLSFIRPARAMSNLSVRLQEPKSQVNTSDVKLTFVALDILGRSITVDCLKKSPTDATFQKFGDSITIIPGGNSGQCNLSPILTTSGSYQFMTTVSVGSESSSSQVVSLDYITSSPGTPVDYRKEEPNDCDYKIHFKTADDSGKTTRVEVYRSPLTSFIADAGSLVSSITIGSNQEYDLTNSVPDCSKTYYYALRAFDSAGNGSNIVGDHFEKIVYTESQTDTAQENLPGALAVEGVTLAQAGESGNPDQTSQTGQANQDSHTQTYDQGQVLGSQTLLSFVSKHKNMAIFIVALAIVAITYVYFAKKKKR